MYLSWKGIAVSGLLGAGIGAGVGAFGGKALMGAGIGLAAGLVLPPTAEGIEGLFDGERAKAVTAMKKLRSAIKAGEPDDTIKFQEEMDNSVLEMSKKAADSKSKT